MTDEHSEILKRLFRYNSFNCDIVKLIDKNNKIERSQEKWKYIALDGMVFTVSPLYFNDPYDCDF